MKQLYFEDIIKKRKVITRLNSNLTFGFCSETLIKLLGYENCVNILNTLNFKELIKNINRKEKIDEILRFISNNNEWTGFVKIKRKKNEYFWTKLYIAPFLYNGVKQGYTFILEVPQKEDILKEVNLEKGN